MIAILKKPAQQLASLGNKFGSQFLYPQIRPGSQCLSKIQDPSPTPHGSFSVQQEIVPCTPPKQFETCFPK